MASLYRRKGTVYWWVKFKDPVTKKAKCESTGLRTDSIKETATAKSLRARLEAKELTEEQRAIAAVPWETWVPDFFERHVQNKGTRGRYDNAWSWLLHWLTLERITSPEQLSYAKAIGYMTWRTQYKKRTGKVVGWNTALMELKLLSFIMHEAVRLGFIQANPIAKLNLKEKEAKKKRALSEEEIDKIREALLHEPEWMQVCFAIGLHTGCRLRETVIDLSNVDLERNFMLFATPKGGAKHAFRIPIPPALRPMFAAMKARKQATTLALPFQPSRRWQQFFHKLGMRDISFHCLRVTMVTRLWQKGVPREQAKALVNHSNDLTHEIYLRSDPQDLAQSQALASFPPSRFDFDAKSQSPTSRPSPQTEESQASCRKVSGPSRSSSRPRRQTPRQ